MTLSLVRRSLLLLATLAVAAGAPSFAVDFERLQATLAQRFGSSASGNFREWRKLLDESKTLSAKEKLKRVNEFFNRRILFADDMQVWGQADYWATPMETLGKGKGDCEDFTIAKYFTLLTLGIPNEQLRLIYVKARIGGPDSRLQQAHMVLAYYDNPAAEPLVLDNLITDIRPASRRPDLTPVFSFNSDGIWQGAGGETQGGTGTDRLSRWADLLRRARAEGFN